MYRMRRRVVSCKWSKLKIFNILVLLTWVMGELQLCLCGKNQGKKGREKFCVEVGTYFVLV